MTITAIVCAYNEAAYIEPCLQALLSQRRRPDEIIVIDNASTDGTGDLARAVPGVRVIVEPSQGLVVARETARRVASGEVLAYVDADCRPPREWLARIERRFLARPALVAVTGPYRFFDWDRIGRTLVRAYDYLVAPPTHWFVHHMSGMGAILYGGNFAVTRDALEQIGGFDCRIEFHGEDTNLGRRLTPVGHVDLALDCWTWTSARRYKALGRWTVFRLYVRNFWSEILRHRPADTTHVDVRA